MIDRLFELLSGRAKPTLEKSADGLELSVAALLIEAARLDNKFDVGERIVIERLLAKSFSLDSQGVQSLVEEAERMVQYSAQYFPFTQQICKRARTEERLQIIEMLWKVVYSDGTLDAQEDALIRQVAGLIHVPDRERGAARKRALEKLARTPARSTIR